MPLLCEWNDEKNASLDWSNPEEVLSNGFTFLQIVAAHPALRKHYEALGTQEEGHVAKTVFLRGTDMEKAEWLTRWHREGLLSLRSERWCRYCGEERHTRLGCPKRLGVSAAPNGSSEPASIPADVAVGTAITPSPSPTSTPSVLMKHVAHMQRVELRRILEERMKPRVESGVQRYGAVATKRPGSSTTAFAGEERRRGIVGRLDVANNIGFISVTGTGELKFFVDRVDVGIKTVAVGDAVTFKPDSSRDYPIAVDVRHERPVVSLDDVRAFLHRCRTARHPIRIMGTLLMHAHEWFVLLRWMEVIRGQNSALYQEAVHTLVELTTFVGNREPIHVPVFRAFLTLLCSAATPTGPTTAAENGGTHSHVGHAPASDGATAVASSQRRLLFYPDMVKDALELHFTNRTTDVTPPAEERLVEDRWAEVVQLVVLVRCYAPQLCKTAKHPEREHRDGDSGSANSTVDGDVEPESGDAVVRLLQAFFSERQGRASGVAARRLQLLLNRLALPTPSSPLSEKTSSAKATLGVGGSISGLALVPTATELAIPPPDPASVFTPSNLPVNGATTYVDTEHFIRDQCALLRADTFEAVSRLLPAVCFHLPGYTPSAETLADVQHARVYSQVRFVGKVVTRDRDYSHPESFLLEVHPQSAAVNLQAQLHQGTTVCISTALDPTFMRDDELFWGVVSSCDAELMKVNVIAVSPCEGSPSFDLMCAALDRNMKAGRTDRSFLLETPIFMAGYESIMRALDAFCGPLAMPLPLVSELVGPLAATAAEATAEPERVAGSCLSNANACNGLQGELVEYIPPHCAVAFREITDDLCKRFTLDEGQEAVMRQLASSKMILVQGPPGTGKSFIGCRVVESYVRYKQLVASGDVLQKISIDMLSSTRLEELLPQVGPMVVITYKNHALDEFLLDLLDSGLWGDNRPQVGHDLAAGMSAATASTGLSASAASFPGGKRLVRIGGRSREGRLDGYNLGALLHGSMDRTSINSLKDRLFVLNQRLERLTKEIHYLEQGRVPRVYFERLLTVEQRRHITFEERESWLAGDRYVGILDKTHDAVSPTHFQSLLQTRMAQMLSGSRASPEEGVVNAALPGNIAKAGTEEEEDVSLSVFQEMRREEEQREYNSQLHEMYLSAESLKIASQPPKRPDGVPTELLSPWSLTPRLRHEFYAYLIANAIAAKARDCLTIMETMKSVVCVRRHAIDELKLSLLQGADVIGLTTTGCAMNQNLLRSLRPSVLVVEEAAEVLESQLLACMTDSLKQIILIGDHYQLQPKVDTFLYEKVNHLNLSLFERLAQRMHPTRLTEQRRMHPSISRLIRPFYTPEPLIDHMSLSTRPFPSANGQLLVERVPGLARRVYFWRHLHPEEEAPGSRSKVNTREIHMVQRVVTHLVSQGVLQKSITVITPYLGQCRMMRGVLRLCSLADVRVSTVDLFQGDENDVIVLSLVRTTKLTDFIRTRNRLIVSCSRARFAMVMVGSDALLRQCRHWEQVLDQLEAENGIGEALPITYRENPSKVTWLRVTETVSAAALEAELATMKQRAATAPVSAPARAADNVKGHDGEEAGDAAAEEG